ncbi:putative Ig domain-containing protein [Kitasatospora mediocidica]|uniref:putative Ig domain-containing protein n=1 Tax=Kitasatospora mediocidica TaxID=58352 RepID=UPI001E49BDC5|nr:putative Ig domain-containing protein [Kitasatospora mediocidica]
MGSSIAALLVGGAVALSSADAAVTTGPSVHHDAATAQHYREACPPASPGHYACNALVRTDVRPQAARAGAAPDATVSGYGPGQLQSAYNLAAAAASGGKGQTVAIVDAYDDPNAESDLGVYRSQFALPACTVANGCFSKLNQDGQTQGLPAPAPANDDWTGEESLDIDMVSAICPNCHILLVEANSESNSDLGTAVNAAVKAGAKFVSNSYGGPEGPGQTSEDTQYYNHPGVAITASTGDSGYGVEYPAASQYVTAVGGTALTQTNNARGWSESVWSTSPSEGAGSGCSGYDPKPSWQSDNGCAKRTVGDVSAVADPATGVAIYATFNGNGGWNVFGGTSASSPIIAAVYALAGPPAAGTAPAAYPYAHTSALNDVTSGATASCSPQYLCTAGAGYDGPTGLGTPNGTAAFTAAAATGGGGTGGGTGGGGTGGGDTGGGGGSTAPGNGVTVSNPGKQIATVGTAASLQITAVDSTPGQTVSYRASGLPAGLAISATGLISGTPTTAGTSNVTVTATDRAGTTGTAAFTWTVSSATSQCTAGQLLGDQGFENGANSAPWKSTPGVLNNQMTAQPSHSGSWDAWLDGYGQAATDTLRQTVTIPTGCAKAALSYWMHVETAKHTGQAADTLKVQVIGSKGTTTVATYSNLNAHKGYQQYTFDLSAWIGQTVTVQFTGTENSSPQPTSFALDDTALKIS